MTQPTVNPTVALFRSAEKSYNEGDLQRAHDTYVNTLMYIWGEPKEPPSWWDIEKFDDWARLEQERLADEEAWERKQETRKGAWRRAAEKVGLKI